MMRYLLSPLVGLLFLAQAPAQQLHVLALDATPELIDLQISESGSVVNPVTISNEGSARKIDREYADVHKMGDYFWIEYPRAVTSLKLYQWRTGKVLEPVALASRGDALGLSGQAFIRKDGDLCELWPKLVDPTTYKSPAKVLSFCLHGDTVQPSDGNWSEYQHMLWDGSIPGLGVAPIMHSLDGLLVPGFSGKDKASALVTIPKNLDMDSGPFASTLGARVSQVVAANERYLVIRGFGAGEETSKYPLLVYDRRSSTWTKIPLNLAHYGFFRLFSNLLAVSDVAVTITKDNLDDVETDVSTAALIVNLEDGSSRRIFGAGKDSEVVYISQNRALYREGESLYWISLQAGELRIGPRLATDPRLASVHWAYER